MLSPLSAAGRGRSKRWAVTPPPAGGRVAPCKAARQAPLLHRRRRCQGINSAVPPSAPVPSILDSTSSTSCFGSASLIVTSGGSDGAPPGGGGTDRTGSWRRPGRAAVNGRACGAALERRPGRLGASSAWEPPAGSALTAADVIAMLQWNPVGRSVNVGSCSAESRRLATHGHRGRRSSHLGSPMAAPASSNPHRPANMRVISLPGGLAQVPLREAPRQQLQPSQARQRACKVQATQAAGGHNGQSAGWSPPAVCRRLPLMPPAPANECAPRLLPPRLGTFHSPCQAGRSARLSPAWGRPSFPGC